MNSWKHARGLRRNRSNRKERTLKNRGHRHDVRSTNQCRVYGMRSTLKWHPYEPAVVGSVQAFFDLVNEDRLHCFFG